MQISALSPCPGCGALFPPHDGPTHRYLGASAGCWALFSWSVVSGRTDVTELLAQSRIPENRAPIPARSDAPSIEPLWGDAYGVQHHGGSSPQAIQSVAVHLLNLHGIISGKTTRHGWEITRALRVRGVFHKLAPPPLGSALTFRHLFPGGELAVRPREPNMSFRSTKLGWRFIVPSWNSGTNAMWFRMKLAEHVLGKPVDDQAPFGSDRVELGYALVPAGGARRFCLRVVL